MRALQAVVFACASFGCPGFQHALEWQWKSKAPATSDEQITSKPDYMFPMTEDGFKAVVALNDEDEVKSFIRRRAREEGILIKNRKRFDAFLENAYKQKDSLNLLKVTKMLERAPFATKGKGRTASLTENGYQEVAKLKSADQMLLFAKRVLAANKKQAPTEKLMLLVPDYDGEVHVRNFTHFKKRLLTAPWSISMDSAVSEGASQNNTNLQTSDPKNDARLLEVRKHQAESENRSGSKVGQILSKLKTVLGRKAAENYGTKTAHIKNT